MICIFVKPKNKRADLNCSFIWASTFIKFRNIFLNLHFQ